METERIAVGGGKEVGHMERMRKKQKRTHELGKTLGRQK
jgi:hypothetical protein